MFTDFGVIEFARPVLFCLSPVPLIVRAALVAATRFDGSIWLPMIDEFKAASTKQIQRRGGWPMAALTLVWLFLILASARPQLVEELPPAKNIGHDLLLAIDTSESMRLTDFTADERAMNRLQASQEVASDFIARRDGDRVGLILFGTNAYLQAPLTLDRETVAILLNETSIGLAGGKTAIGEAIALAVLRLREVDAKQRVLVLMTDGANTAGEVSPQVAARLAARAGLKIYTIGIGSPPADDLRAPGPSSTDALDEESLIAIAAATGGRYFRASDNAMLRNVYAEIDKLETIDRAGESLFRRTELFQWPLGGSLILLLFTDAAGRRQQRWD